jgi:hypothetical protein
MTEAARHIAIAAVQKELAEMAALAQATQLAPRRRRRATGPSVVYSIRLDPAEVAALEARAAAINLKPTMLARNLIRTGLARGCDGEGVARAVDRLEAALGELRAVLW